jgi:purine-binding chemotaxis protein CheW
VSDGSGADVQLCTFAVGGLLLALPVRDVVEVVRGQDLTPVPLAPASVVGLLNLRGRIVPAVDARLRLGLPPREPGAASAHVVVGLPDEQVSLVVDDTSDVVTVRSADREAVPETVAHDLRRLSTSSYQRAGGLLLVLDPALVLADP